MLVQAPEPTDYHAEDDIDNKPNKGYTELYCSHGECLPYLSLELRRDSHLTAGCSGLGTDSQ